MSYTLLSNTKPRAKKVHQCIWCSENIEVGERYRHERSVYDRRMQNHKWHLECDDAAKEYFSHNGPDFDAWDNERPTERLGFTDKQP